MFVSMKRFATISVLAVLAFATSGCMELRQTLVIDPEAETVDLTLRVGSSTELDGEIPPPPTLDDFAGLAPYLATSSTYDEDQFSGFEATYEDVPFDVVGTAAGERSGPPLSITVRDDMMTSVTWEFLGRSSIVLPDDSQVTTDDLTAPDSDDELPFDFYLSVTNPGARVLFSNATSESGDTVVWEYDSLAEFLDGPEAFRADWDVPGTAGGGASDWIIVVIGLAVVAGVIWFATRGRPTSAQRSQSRLHGMDIPQTPGPTD